MTKSFSRDDCLRLAPDAASAKSGQDLAQPRKWATLGGDELAIWGECKGSGAKPYQVQIELAEPAFKCSCPSRKFPCKHGLGLLLIYATTPGEMAQAPRPAWVQEWLDARQARATKSAEKQARPAPPRDLAAQSKRKEKRIERARAGLVDLSAWMDDVVRGGIGSIPTKGYDFFDSQARRMVDAQAPGVARLVRQLGSLASQGAGWQRPFLEQLSLIHLLARAVQRFEELPPALRADVESTIGITVSADELAALPGVTDRWQVIAQQVELDDRLRVQRSWMFGLDTRRPALVLQFAHGTSGFENSLPAGRQFEGEVVFFPGSGPRAAVRTVGMQSELLSRLKGCASFDETLETFSSALAACPWLERLCLPIVGVTPVWYGGKWWAVDRTTATLPMQVRDEAGYTLLAVSGGMPVDLAAEFDGEILRPLAVVAGGAWTSLATSVEEAV